VFIKVIRQLKRNIKQQIYLFYIRNFKDFIKLTNKPFISINNFKKLSNHVYSKNKKFNLNKLKMNDIIFLEIENLNSFVEHVVNNIEVKINLLIQNSNIVIVEESLNNLLSKNLVIFAQNMNLDIEKYENLHVLPTGFKNRNLIRNAKIKNYLNVSREKVKKNNIFISIDFSKHKNRLDLLKLIFKNEIFVFNRYSEHKTFLNEMSKYKFVACPRGTKIDTVLIWECLYVKSIPVLLKTDFSKNLKHLGIPILEVERWEDILLFSETELNNFYQLESEKFLNNEFSSFLFWDKYIKDNLTN